MTGKTPHIFEQCKKTTWKIPGGKKHIGPIPLLEVFCAQVILADGSEGTRHLQDVIKLRVFSLKNNVVIFTNQGNH